jgi:restriction endonuclease Mrr
VGSHLSAQGPGALHIQAGVGAAGGARQAAPERTWPGHGARLQGFPWWHEVWGTAARDEDSTTGTSEPAQETGTTPEEQIARGIEQLEANVRGELLQRVKDMTPEAFEHLVLKLLGALGYGDGPQSRHGVRRGPDGGIDGNRLTRLMIDAGVGVSVQKTYLVHRVDEDFFAEFEEA